MVPENQTCEKFEWEKARRSSKSPYFPQDLKKDYVLDMYICIYICICVCMIYNLGVIA